MTGAPDPRLTADDGINAAYYYPWIMMSDPKQAGSPRAFPPGGAVARVAPEATAFYHRAGVLWNMQFQAYWTDAADQDANVAWVEAFRESLLPFTRGAYVNLSAGTEDRAIPAIVSVMEGAAAPAVHLTVPIQVDAHAAGNWDEAH